MGDCSLSSIDLGTEFLFLDELFMEGDVDADRIGTLECWDSGIGGKEAVDGDGDGDVVVIIGSFVVGVGSEFSFNDGIDDMSGGGAVAGVLGGAKGGVGDVGDIDDDDDSVLLKISGDSARCVPEVFELCPPPLLLADGVIAGSSNPPSAIRLSAARSTTLRIPSPLSSFASLFPDVSAIDK